MVYGRKFMGHVVLKAQIADQLGLSERGSVTYITATSKTCNGFGTMRLPVLYTDTEARERMHLHPYCLLIATSRVVVLGPRTGMINQNVGSACIRMFTLLLSPYCGICCVENSLYGHVWAAVSSNHWYLWYHLPV